MSAALWLSEAVFMLGIALPILVFFLFPTGSPPPGRWRWVWRAYVTAFVVQAAGWAVLPFEGLTVVKTPVPAPRANAVAERWVGSVRRECLDHIFIFGRRHLLRALGAYAEHYNRSRPHRSLDLQPPDPAPTTHAAAGIRIRRRDVRDGLIHEYQRAAA